MKTQRKLDERLEEHKTKSLATRKDVKSVHNLPYRCHHIPRKRMLIAGQKHVVKRHNVEDVRTVFCNTCFVKPIYMSRHVNYFKVIIRNTTIARTSDYISGSQHWWGFGCCLQGCDVALPSSRPPQGCNTAHSFQLCPSSPKFQDKVNRHLTWPDFHGDGNNPHQEISTKITF
jgi:hypothetical protein